MTPLNPEWYNTYSSGSLVKIHQHQGVQNEVLMNRTIKKLTQGQRKLLRDQPVLVLYPVSIG